MRTLGLDSRAEGSTCVAGLGTGPALPPAKSEVPVTTGKESTIRVLTAPEGRAASASLALNGPLRGSLS